MLQCDRSPAISAPKLEPINGHHQPRTQVALSLSACQKYLVLDQKELKFNRSHFPLLWLRDNCRCVKCFHPEVERRIINWSTFPFKTLALKTYSFDDQTNTVRLLWNDDHESVLNLPFFSAHKFDQETTDAYLKTNYRLEKIPWSKFDSDFEVPKFSLDEILQNRDGGAEMKRWLRALSHRGMAVLQNPSKERREDLVSEFIRIIFGFCKETHYGREFLIQNRISEITNIAYLNGTLQSHTDSPYYDYLPGVTILHFLKQSNSGGMSTLADGYKIAERLKAIDPSAFETLTTVPVNWVDKGVENGLKFHKILTRPVIGLVNGKLDRINFSVVQRDSFFSVSDPKLVQKWYEAMKLFIDLLKEESYEFKMEENDILTFDNSRLLHGRTAYEENEHRLLVGCYVDWDEVYSKYRAIELD